MDGPAHYQRAEKLLAEAFDEDTTVSGRDACIKAAAVHAQLAAATVAALRFDDGLTDGDYMAWLDVAGVDPEPPAEEPAA